MLATSSFVASSHHACSAIIFWASITSDRVLEDGCESEIARVQLS